MKKFSEEFRHIVGKLRSRRPVDALAPSPVVVSLIDDGKLFSAGRFHGYRLIFVVPGTDKGHEDLSFQRPVAGTSFQQYQQGRYRGVSPWWHSSSGFVTVFFTLW